MARTGGLGVFASRSPARPNPFCLSVCELVELEGNRIKVRGLEALDGSPLLDLKPFIRELDCPGYRLRAFPDSNRIGLPAEIPSVEGPGNSLA